MLEPSGHEAGVSSKTTARHAFWSVVSLEGSASGSARKVLPMFAWPNPEVTLTLRLAPLFLLACAPVDASNVGLKGNEPQLATWKGEVMGAVVPWSPVAAPSTFNGLQLVGLNWKFGRSTTTWISFSCAGTPVSGYAAVSTNVGSLLVMIAWPVSRSTFSAERVTTLPKSNGPAFVGITTVSPNGAPL